MSDPEELLAYQIKLMNFPEPRREFKFCDGRRWRFDFAWPGKHWVAVEVEGGTWGNGRHTRGSGFEKDCEKYNTAALLGWKVLRFTTTQIKNGTAVSFLEKVFGD